MLGCSFPFPLRINDGTGSLILVVLVSSFLFQVVVFYGYGIMNQLFSPANAHYADGQLVCWSLLSLYSCCITPRLVV